jgi:hypothetical protein
MDAVYDLKDMLCKELEEYGKKDKLDVGGLEIIDKLAHAIKNLDKIIEKYEEDDYSDAYYDGSYDDGNMNRNMDGTSRRYSMRRYSGARGDGRGRGRNARRDSMGRYSRDGRMMAQELRELMDDAPNDSIKMEIQRIAQKVENM